MAENVVFEQKVSKDYKPQLLFFRPFPLDCQQLFVLLRLIGLLLLANPMMRPLNFSEYGVALIFPRRCSEYRLAAILGHQNRSITLA